MRVSNDTSQPAKVTIHLRPSRSLLRSKGDTTAVIPANSQTTVMVPVNAVGSGDIDVKVSMKNALGQPVGSSSTVHMRVRANWESWFTCTPWSPCGDLRRVSNGKSTNTGAL